MSVDQELIESLEIQLKAAKEGRLKAILLYSIRYETKDGEARKAGAGIVWAGEDDAERNQALVFCADQIKRENKQLFKAAKMAKPLFDALAASDDESEAAGLV